MILLETFVACMSSPATQLATVSSGFRSTYKVAVPLNVSGEVRAPMSVMSKVAAGAGECWSHAHSRPEISNQPRSSNLFFMGGTSRCIDPRSYDETVSASRKLRVKEHQCRSSAAKAGLSSEALRRTLIRSCRRGQDALTTAGGTPALQSFFGSLRFSGHSGGAP